MGQDHQRQLVEPSAEGVRETSDTHAFVCRFCKRSPVRPTDQRHRRSKQLNLSEKNSILFDELSVPRRETGLEARRTPRFSYHVGELREIRNALK